MTAETAQLSKSQLAFRVVHDRIVDGTYPPGQRLVLDAIGTELGMSVVPVREAIRRLEAEGLVSFERNVGARVAEIDEHEYWDTMETLSYVEGAAAHVAAPYVTAAAVARARELNAQLRGMLDDLDPVAFTRTNELLHRTLTDPCPNAHLRDLVDRGWRRLARLRASTFSFVPARAAESVDEHDRILDLVEAGADALEIELAVRAHRLATPNAYLRRAPQDGAAHRQEHR